MTLTPGEMSESFNIFFFFFKIFFKKIPFRGFDPLSDLFQGILRGWGVPRRFLLLAQYRFPRITRQPLKVSGSIPRQGQWPTELAAIREHPRTHKIIPKKFFMYTKNSIPKPSTKVYHEYTNDLSLLAPNPLKLIKN